MIQSEETGMPVLQPGWSGPIRIPMDQESPAIRQAPAYDIQMAKARIPDMQAIRDQIGSLGSDQELTAFGPKAPSESAMHALADEIRHLSCGGHKISVIMADANTHSGISYRSSLPMCSQSTIKAVYAGALLESRPQAFLENGQWLHDAVVYSLNEPYHALREVYGSAPIRNWCKEAGVDPAFAEELYPRMHTARDMLKMWTRLYEFLNSGRDVHHFGAYYADTSASATRKQLGSRFPVQTKAGWECGLDEDHNYDPAAVIPEAFRDGDPSNDECAINDTGIVYTPAGPYLFVIYTDHPFGIFRDYVTPNPLYGLVEKLYALRMNLQTMETEP